MFQQNTIKCIKTIEHTILRSIHPINFGYLFLLLAFSATLSAQPKIGEKVPDIALPDLKGSVRKLTDIKNKVVLVDFWASWCGPCRRSNPNLVRLYKKYKENGLEIYSISIDEDKSAWKKAVAKDNMTWAQVIESKGWDGPVASSWKIEQLPTAYLVNRAGRVVAIDPFGKELERKIIKELKK